MRGIFCIHVKRNPWLTTIYTIEPQTSGPPYLYQKDPSPLPCTKTTPLSLCMYQNDTPAKSCTKTNPLCRNVPKRRVPLWGSQSLQLFSTNPSYWRVLFSFFSPAVETPARHDSAAKRWRHRFRAAMALWGLRFQFVVQRVVSSCA